MLRKAADIEKAINDIGKSIILSVQTICIRLWDTYQFRDEDHTDKNVND